jgi:hypothetical protein
MMCRREVGPVLEGMHGPYRSWCYGVLRALYVREISAGQPRGWRRVGTVCLQCHAVNLDVVRLPPGPLPGG